MLCVTGQTDVASTQGQDIQGETHGGSLAFMPLGYFCMAFIKTCSLTAKG